MSDEKREQVIEALKELPETKKEFVLGFAAGLTAKEADKEPEKKEAEKNA